MSDLSVNDTVSSGDTVIRILNADPIRLNPVLTVDTPSRYVNNFIYSSLLTADENFCISPCMASFDEIEKGRVTLFHLNQNIRWHDGTPFTSRDVLFTVLSAKKEPPESFFRVDFSSLETLEIIDDYTFRAVHCYPVANYLHIWTLGIIPEHLLHGEKLSESVFNQHPCGTGPFRLEKWTEGEEIVLKAFKEYFAGPPFLDSIIIRIIPDRTISFQTLLSLHSDIAEITPDQFLKTASSDIFQKYYIVENCPTPDYLYIAYDPYDPRFKDRRVRQALTMAVNREEIIRKAVYSIADELSGPFSPSHYAYDHKITPLPFNPEKSISLLSELGITDSDHDGILEYGKTPFTISLCLSNGDESRRIVAEMVSSYWKNIGIVTNLEIDEYSVFLNKYFNQISDAWLVSNNTGYLVDSWNSFISEETDRKISALLEEAKKTHETPQRRKIYHEFCSILAQEQPYTYLYSPRKLTAVSKRIRGISRSSEGLDTAAQRWYVPKNMQRY